MPLKNPKLNCVVYGDSPCDLIPSLLSPTLTFTPFFQTAVFMLSFVHVYESKMVYFIHDFKPVFFFARFQATAAV
jgi:hypothetical protein